MFWGLAENHSLRSVPKYFIDTFCDPNLVCKDFKNQLGHFTPCFTDIVVLGTAHLSAIILSIIRLSRLYRSRTATYRMTGVARGECGSAIAACAMCCILLFSQLSGRIASDTFPLIRGKVAPFEICGYGLALLSWALLCAVFCVQMNRFSSKETWLWRFPIIFIFVGELAKLRFVVLLTKDHNYFFYLYVVYVAVQAYLVLLALFFVPSVEDMILVEDKSEDYMALGDGSEEDICPESKAGLFSQLTFAWVGPLLRKGYRAPLQMRDIWPLATECGCATLSRQFDQHWQKQLEKDTGQPSLLYAVWQTCGHLLLQAIPFKVLNDVSQFVGPVFLNLLLQVVAAGGPAIVAYGYAVLMLAGLIIGTISDNQHFQRVMRAGYRVRSILVHAVFRKILSLSPTARSKFSSGQMFNLVSTDTEQVQSLSQFILGTISFPIRIGGSLVLLYRLLGPASLVALAVLMMSMPLQAVIVRMSAKLLKQSLGLTDERAKAEKEVLTGMDVVKCSTWEDAFWDRIQGVRNQELGVLWRSFVLSALNVFLLNAIPTLVSVMTFAVYVLLGHELTAATAFTSLTLFNVLRMPLFQLPQLISQLINTRVSMNRLQEFLAAEETSPMPQHDAAKPGQTALSLHGAFQWDTSLGSALTDIHVEVGAGEFLVIVGPTGSGKSSILCAALGLMHQAEGPQPLVRGKVAYVPQQAFIFNGTVRDNILFGLPFDPERYDSAIQASALGPDLLQLPGGDMTELGDQGVNISGGQKQRVAIARAVYSNADTYLFDDPLSALDAKVGRQVFNVAFLHYLKDKTRVLVTNQLQYVSHADQVLFMHNGTISEKGTYQQLMDNKAGFSALMKQAEVEQEADEYGDAQSALYGSQKDRQGGASSQSNGVPGVASATSLPPTADGDSRKGVLTEKEHRATGSLRWSVIGSYLAAMSSPVLVAFMLATFLLVEAIRLGTTLWLANWTQVVQQEGGAPHGSTWYLLWYSVLSGVQVLIQLANALEVKRLAVRAAKSMHNGMLARILRAPMSFFHATPQGRIINRLTKDTSDVDKNVADFTAMFIRGGLQLASTIALVGFVTPFTLSAIAPILLMFYFLYTYFQATVREVKRLDAISRSPVYSSIGEAISGLATIRAYHAEQRSSQRNAELLDRNIVTTHVNMSTNRWLGVRLESLGALSAFAAALFAVEQKGGASTMGLTLSYALQITQLTNMTVRLASLAETSFNAVERVVEYCQLPQEPAAVVPGSVPPGWPEKGKIEFREVELRYRPGLPLVLEGLTVTMREAEKVGIVGRTGAGKSSILNALFRLVELCGGAIVIDGVDVGKIGLKQLRSALALIPQSPVLFAGTIRSNLDPFFEHTDDQLWGSLHRAHLGPLVGSVAAKLDMVIGEGGSPLSAGQKQLLALARALLKHSKVLVLDEATANVDVETDALVQTTVREEFVDCTMIAVAHRLHTIIDCDKILVMDKGVAAEFGSPAELLCHPDGAFTSMVSETGAATEAFLRSVAFGESEKSEALHKQASLGFEKVRQLSACEDTKLHAAQLLDKTLAAQDLLNTLLLKMKEQDRAEKRGQVLGMDGSALSPFLSDCQVDTNTMQMIHQAASTMSDILHLAEMANVRLNASSDVPAAAVPAVLTSDNASPCSARSAPSLARSISTPPSVSTSFSSRPTLRPTLSSKNMTRRAATASSSNTNIARLASEDPSVSGDPGLH